MKTIRTLTLAVISISASTWAQSFRFDDATQSCRDAAGREGWNVGVRGPCADFRGADLAGVSFRDEDLRGARFDGAKLNGASFFRAELTAASFNGAQLRGAVLSGATLRQTSLQRASLVDAKLIGASLQRADLRGADLRSAALHRASFSGADLRGALFSQHKALLEGARWAAARVDETTQLPFTLDERLARRFDPGTVVAATR